MEALFWQGENYERFNKRCRITYHLFSVYPFLGAIGIGTFIAAYGIGKIVGFMLKHLQPGLKEWVFKANEEEND